MTMNSMDARDIIEATLDGFKVRCNHRGIYPKAADLDVLRIEFGSMLVKYCDDTSLQQGEVDLS